MNKKKLSKCNKNMKSHKYKVVKIGFIKELKIHSQK